MIEAKNSERFLNPFFRAAVSIFFSWLSVIEKVTDRLRSTSFRLIFFKTEKQKFTIKENVMSEQVKMPNRHFLRSDIFTFVMVYSFYFLFVGSTWMNSIVFGRN